MAASNLFYIKVLGIQPDFTIDDIVAYFQTARCGSGIVDKVIYLDAKKSAVLIGIEGLTDRGEYSLWVFWLGMWYVVYVHYEQLSCTVLQTNLFLPDPSSLPALGLLKKGLEMRLCTFIVYADTK